MVIMVANPNEASRIAIDHDRGGPTVFPTTFVGDPVLDIHGDVEIFMKCIENGPRR